MLVYDSFNIECSLAYSVVTEGATATGFRQLTLASFRHLDEPEA